MMNDPTENILVVDDTLESRDMFVAVLEEEGYSVRGACSGSEMLQLAHEAAPSLILLDVNMPEMSGYEACESLKEAAELQEIPVLFVSANSQTIDIVRAFDVGGVDYVVKPVRIHELVARVRTHLEIRRLRNELRAHNERLESMVERRTAELTAANFRLRELDRLKDDFLHMISHELRTPLNGVLGIAQIALLGDLSSDERESLQSDFQRASERMTNLIESALLIKEIEGQKTPVEAEVYSFGEIWESAAFRAGVPMESLPSDDSLMRAPVYCNRQLMTLALSTAIELARRLCEVDAPTLTHAKHDATIVDLRFFLPNARLTMEICEEFFAIGTSVRSRSNAQEMGLAPIAASRIFRLHEGNISLEPIDEKDAQLNVMIPCVR